jgi:hypothetical protein
MEESPSAPTTRSYVASVPLSNRTSTPPACSVKPAIESPNRYVALSRLCSYNTRDRSDRSTSSSPPANSPGNRSSCRPAESTKRIGPAHSRQPWRQALKTWALDLYAVFAEHPWLLQAMIGRRLLGPNELAWLDRGIQAITDSGLDGGEQFDAILVLSSHVRNIAQQTISSGLTEQHLNQAFAEILATESARFPSLAAAMRTAAGSANQGLEFGLERILDGLELLISGRKG